MTKNASNDNVDDLGKSVVDALNASLFAGKPEAIYDDFAKGYVNHNPDVADGDLVANKAIIEGFLTRVLVNGEEVDMTTFINPTSYIQHNSEVADGQEGYGAFMAQMAEQGQTMSYSKIHKIMAQGNFVLVMSEGAIGNEPQAFYDLFRLEKGLIVEHWDVITPMPAPDAPTNNSGKF